MIVQGPGGRELWNGALESISTLSWRWARTNQLSFYVEYVVSKGVRPGFN